MDHPTTTDPPLPGSPTISPLGGPHADKVWKTGFGFSLSIHALLTEKMKFSNRKGQCAGGICPRGVFHLAALFQKHHYLRYQCEPTQPDWTGAPDYHPCSLRPSQDRHFQNLLADFIELPFAYWRFVVLFCSFVPDCSVERKHAAS